MSAEGSGAGKIPYCFSLSAADKALQAGHETSQQARFFTLPLLTRDYFRPAFAAFLTFSLCLLRFLLHALNRFGRRLRR